MANALDIIERRESGGRNIYQQLVPRSVSSASGYFQMIKPTWQRWAKAAGVDINKYPEAIDAPYEVQRQVAAQGFRQEGFKPWLATKHLVGQEKNYDTGAPPAGVLASNPAAPVQVASLDPTAPAATGGLSGAMQTALKYQGMNETANGKALGEFMASKGIPFTPQNVAWCAAFVNSSLAAQGLPTTGSNMARSFLNWGQATTTPNQGDIAVFSRTGNPALGHVGFYGGTVDRDGQQYIRIFGGNQGGPAKGGGEAGWTEMPASRLLGYRTMPGGAPAPSGSAPLTQVAANSVSAPVPPPDNSGQLIAEGLQGLLGGPPPAAPPPQAPVSEPEQAPPAMPVETGPSQGEAASLMASILDRKRAARVPGFFEMGAFG